MTHPLRTPSTTRASTSIIPPATATMPLLGSRGAASSTQARKKQELLEKLTTAAAEQQEILPATTTSSTTPTARVQKLLSDNYNRSSSSSSSCSTAASHDPSIIRDNTTSSEQKIFHRGLQLREVKKQIFELQLQLAQLTKEDPQLLDFASKFLKKDHIDGIVEERAMVDLCGRFGCKNLNILSGANKKKKYLVRDRGSKVLELNELGKFCSMECQKKVFLYKEEKLSNEPEWSTVDKNLEEISETVKQQVAEDLRRERARFDALLENRDEKDQHEVGHSGLASPALVVPENIDENLGRRGPNDRKNISSNAVEKENPTKLTTLETFEDEAGWETELMMDESVFEQAAAAMFPTLEEVVKRNQQQGKTTNYLEDESRRSSQQPYDISSARRALEVVKPPSTTSAAGKINRRANLQQHPVVNIPDVQRRVAAVSIVERGTDLPENDDRRIMPVILEEEEEENYCLADAEAGRSGEIKATGEEEQNGILIEDVTEEAKSTSCGKTTTTRIMITTTACSSTPNTTASSSTTTTPELDRAINDPTSFASKTNIKTSGNNYSTNNAQDNSSTTTFTVKARGPPASVEGGKPEPPVLDGDMHPVDGDDEEDIICEEDDENDNEDVNGNIAEFVDDSVTENKAQADQVDHEDDGHFSMDSIVQSFYMDTQISRNLPLTLSFGMRQLRALQALIQPSTVELVRKIRERGKAAKGFEQDVLAQSVEQQEGDEQTETKAGTAVERNGNSVAEKDQESELLASSSNKTAQLPSRPAKDAHLQKTKQMLLRSQQGSTNEMMMSSTTNFWADEQAKRDALKMDNEEGERDETEYQGQGQALDETDHASGGEKQDLQSNSPTQLPPQRITEGTKSKETNAALSSTSSSLDFYPVLDTESDRVHRRALLQEWASEKKLVRETEAATVTALSRVIGTFSSSAMRKLHSSYATEKEDRMFLGCFFLEACGLDFSSGSDADQGLALVGDQAALSSLGDEEVVERTRCSFGRLSTSDWFQRENVAVEIQDAMWAMLK
ncbi:unnamed protein product [Amoebophrya sp. A120]|nr:unnamed protein product [Amoebophrya sp. A120]|eukprot:GSA120T00008675001.1